MIMVEIHDIWISVDTENNNKITLFNHPRISIHVDEYICSFIEENIVKPDSTNGWYPCEDFVDAR